MRQTGKAGPDHALRQAELQILRSENPTHEMSERTVATGPGHRIFLAIPKAAPPENGWPILYLLDGNAAYDYLTATHLALAPGLVIAGIGYDTDRQFSRERRTLDFTPPDGPGDGIRPDPVHPGRLAGGGAVFLDRLTGPLREAAEQGLRIDPRRRTLWGHSFGGLFTLYVLLSRPRAFARYAAISPSVWWDEPLMQRIAAQAPVLEAPVLETPTREAPPPLLIALGDREKRSGSDGPVPDGPAPATMHFLETLREFTGLRPALHVLREHVHIQTLAGSLPLVFPFAAEE